MIGRLSPEGARVRLLAPLVAVLAVALILRFVWIVYIDDGLHSITLPPLADRGPAYTGLLVEKLTDDQAFYVRAAQYLAEGKGYREPFSESVTARWPPGYPLILSALFAVVGPSILAAQMLNVFLGVLSVWVVYLLGARLFDRRVAVTAAALLALFPGQVYLSGLMMTEVVFTTGLMAVLWLVLTRLPPDRRPRPWWLAATGLALGGLAMIRGEVAFVAPVLGVYWLTIGISWKRAAAQTAIVLAAMMAVYVPWTVRNIVQLHAPVVLTTGTGGALIQGHAEGATGDLNQEIYDDLRAQYEDLPEPRRQVAENNAGIRESLKFMVTHPLDELRLVPLKLYFLYRDDPGGRTWAQLVRFGVEGTNVLQRLGNGYYLLVLWLAIMGAVTSGRRMLGGERMLLLLVIVSWSLVFGFVYVGDGRYHFPLVPFFCLFAASFGWWALTGQFQVGQQMPGQGRPEGGSLSRARRRAKT
jgi:4-amino-4-deoxy-L-arabinose transferase-like glycosyltransferase